MQRKGRDLELCTNSWIGIFSITLQLSRRIATASRNIVQVLSILQSKVLFLNRRNVLKQKSNKKPIVCFGKVLVCQKTDQSSRLSRGPVSTKQTGLLRFLQKTTQFNLFPTKSWPATIAYKFDGNSVDAKSFAGGPWSVVENVAQMGVTLKREPGALREL